MKRVAAALAVLSAILSFVPGPPGHGFGAMLYLLPAVAFLRRPKERRRLLLYAAAILLQTLAFPEIGFAPLGFLLLLPYLEARQLEDGARWWGAALLFGFFRAFSAFSWLGNVHFLPWVATCFASGIAFAAVFEAGVRYGRFVPFALRVATAWVAFEWVHTWFLGGLPWSFLAHAQHRFLPFIQSADLAGVPLVSFLIAFAQAAAFEAFRARRYRALAAAALLVALNLLYGFTRPAEGRAGGPGVLLVQCSFGHDVKEGDEPEAETIEAELRELTDRGLAAHPETALVVWPETLFPYPWIENDVYDRFGFAATTFDLAARYRRPFVYGVNTFTDDAKVVRNRGHNSAVLVDAAGRILGVYRKQRLVPMGELFLPRVLFPASWCDRWVAWLMDLGYPLQCDLEEGDSYATLDAGPGLRCALLICFEGLYPDMARKALATGSPDLLLHLANHGWFRRSWAQEQAVASFVFRAIETRTPFLSCANTGVTCAVGPSGARLGSISEPLGRGFLEVKLPPRGPLPLAQRGGPYLFAGLLGALSAGFFAAARLRRNRLDSFSAF